MGRASALFATAISAASRHTVPNIGWCALEPSLLVAKARPMQGPGRHPAFPPTDTGPGEESGAICPEPAEGVCICANAAVMV
jgi:hypothetical protein